ncbi:MAG: hypothetical protein AB1659_12170, partial [Thermodesulfobacteriota bacterium]
IYSCRGADDYCRSNLYPQVCNSPRMNGVNENRMTGWPGFSIGVFVLMLLSVLDTCILTQTESKRQFKVVAGRSENITGKLSDPVDPRLLKEVFAADRNRSQDDLLNTVVDYEPKSPGFEIRFKSIEGRLWRGELRVKSNAAEGTYPLFIIKAGETPGERTEPVFIQVFNNEEDYRKSYWSLGKRFFGIEPWWLAIFMFPVAILSIYQVMRRTTREDEVLQARGIGPIYKLVKQKTHWEIAFGLGAFHGVKPGDRLVVLRPDGSTAGNLEAKTVEREFSEAILKLDADISPDHTISRFNQPQ